MVRTINKGDIVIFDVDDTLGFFTTSFDNWLAKRFGTESVDRSKFLDYNLIAPWAQHFPKGANAAEVLKDFEATGAMADYKRFHPTTAFILAQKLQELGIMTLALTARGWMQDGHGTTRKWLESLGLKMPTYVLGLKDSKAEWINKHYPIVQEPEGKIWLFEDNPFHLQEVYRKCPQVESPIIVDHPHNRFLSSMLFTRVDPYTTEWMTTWPNCVTLH